MQALQGFVSRIFNIRFGELVRFDYWRNIMASYTTRRSLQTEHKKEVEEKKQKFLSMKLPDKRKLYKCKDKYTVLESIFTWPEYFEETLKEDEQNTSLWKRNKRKVTKDVSEKLNGKLSIFTGDITTLEIDAIANAANESLLGGGGVDGAIHAAAGPALRSECELLNGCSAGDAKISLGYKLPAKYVIHTVGPRGENSERLKSCYEKSLDLLKENELRSVAFPCISTGIFGYPNENAAKVALGTIREWLENDDNAKNVDRIIMCLFLKKDINIYHEQMQMFFPLSSSDSEASPQKQDTEEVTKEGTSKGTSEASKENTNEASKESNNEVSKESTKENTKEVINNGEDAAKQDGPS